MTDQLSAPALTESTGAAGETPDTWRLFADGHRGHEIIADGRGFKSIGYIYGAEDAAFVLRACQSHADLLEACRAAEVVLSDFEQGIVYADSVNEGVLKVVRAAIASAAEVQP